MIIYIPTLASFMIVIAGVYYMFSQGQSEKLAAAKKILTSIAIGLFIAYAAWIVIELFFMTIGVVGFTNGAWSTINCPTGGSSINANPSAPTSGSSPSSPTLPSSTLSPPASALPAPSQPLWNTLSEGEKEQLLILASDNKSQFLNGPLLGTGLPRWYKLENGNLAVTYYEESDKSAKSIEFSKAEFSQLWDFFSSAVESETIRTMKSLNPPVDYPNKLILSLKNTPTNGDIEVVVNMDKVYNDTETYIKETMGKSEIEPVGGNQINPFDYMITGPSRDMLMQ